jgi:hypothetical protein
MPIPERRRGPGPSPGPTPDPIPPWAEPTPLPSPTPGPIVIHAGHPRGPKPQDLMTPTDELPDMTDTSDPTQVPPHVSDAIKRHQSGSPMKPAWIDPQLHDDLVQFYGGENLIVPHDPAKHGNLDGQQPLPERSQADTVTGDRMAIDPATLDKTQPSQPQPKDQPKVIINDQPGTPKPAPDPSTLAKSELPGRETKPPPGLVGPGVKFDGKQYLYWNGSSWAPVPMSQPQPQQLTPPGLA